MQPSSSEPHPPALPPAARVLILSNAPSASTPALELISESAVADEVSAVAQALRELGWQPQKAAVTTAAEIFRQLDQVQPDLVFNLCEGLNGDSAGESNVAAILDSMGVHYTGNHPLVLGLARNKNLTKKILVASGIPTPDWVYYESVPSAAPAALGYPLIVKPACEDASLGILDDAVVRDFPGLRKNCRRLLEQYPRDGVLVEKFIAGREISVALLPASRSVRALPPSEIDFSGFQPGADQIVSYKAKWVTDDELYRTTPSRCPAAITPELQERLQDMAVSVHQALGADSYGRVDFRVDSNDHPFVLEYNPNPDISPGAGYSNALAAAGLSYPDFVQIVIQAALARRKNAGSC